MKIKGIIWLGTRTDRFEQMTDFCRDVMGLGHQSQVKHFNNLSRMDMASEFG